MSNGKIIILEGTSCVGKTTLCKNLIKQNWIVLPEAIRYLEKETGKKGDEASPIPNSIEEEKYYQDQLFRIEWEKLIEANRLRNQGKNVVIDKSAIATVATAKVFETQKGFKGTFKRAFLKYCDMVKRLDKKGFIECDSFILLTANYDSICNRNQKRGHILEGIWIEKDTIENQRYVLEKMLKNIVGNIGKNNIRKLFLDTTNLSEKQVVEKFNSYIIYRKINAVREENTNDRSSHTYELF